MKKIIIFVIFLLLGNVYAEELVIVHISDPHLGVSQTWDQRFSDVLWMAEQQAQMIFITGDITNGPTKKKVHLENFINRTKDLTIPWLVVRGNHDEINTFREIVGPLEWFYDMGNYRIIGINSLDVNFDQLNQWLIFNKTLIIIGHQPLNCGNSPCMSRSVATELRKLFKQYQVLAYFAGHEHHATIKMDESGTILITGPSTRDGNYLLVTIQDSIISDVVNIKIAVTELPMIKPPINPIINPEFDLNYN